MRRRLLSIETGYECETQPSLEVLNGDETPMTLATSGRYVYWGDLKTTCGVTIHAPTRKISFL